MLKVENIHSHLTKVSKFCLLGIGIATAYQAPTIASQPEATKPEADIAQTATANVPLPNGVHLYGQSSEPGKIGSEYLVFEVQQERVVGASYLPHSEFSCFTGTINSQQMALSIVDPYTQSVHPYSIAIQEGSSVASAGDQVPHTVELIGYQKVGEISDNDRRMLNTCLDNYQ